MSDLPLRTTTLERPAAKEPKLFTAARRKAARRWWRRKPITKLLVWLHRWPGLILGLLLVVETTAGSILLYKGELYRLSNSDLYSHTSVADPIRPVAAIDVVNKAHPQFKALWVAKDNGIYTVGNADYRHIYFVDPATGTINGDDYPDRGFLGFVVNLHDCALTCEGYTAYQSWLSTPVWAGGPTFLTGITWGGGLLGILGVLMILLFVTGIKLWWPALRKLGQRFYRVRRGKGRFARDYDLHNVIAAWAMPFILMWGITGAAFEFPGVKDGWVAITGGDTLPEQDFSLTPYKVAAGTPQISADEAARAALDAVPGHVTFIGVPSRDSNYFEIDIVTGYGSRENAPIYGGGDSYVLVDPHDAAHLKALYTSKGDPAANRFYDKFLEPSHFGENVNSWWRILWLLFGLAPLALLVTGVSTWLFRRGVKKRRKAALAASGAAIAPVDRSASGT